VTVEHLLFFWKKMMDSRMPERYFGDLTDITDACWGSSSLQGICPPPLTNLSQQQQEQRQQ